MLRFCLGGGKLFNIVLNSQFKPRVNMYKKMILGAVIYYLLWIAQKLKVHHMKYHNFLSYIS